MLLPWIFFILSLVLLVVSVLLPLYVIGESASGDAESYRLRLTASWVIPFGFYLMTRWVLERFGGPEKFAQPALVTAADIGFWLLMTIGFITVMRAFHTGPRDEPIEE